MLIKEFENVNCSVLTYYTIRSRTRAKIVEQFSVDYTAPFEIWTKQKAMLTSYQYAKVIRVEAYNNSLYIKAEIID